MAGALLLIALVCFHSKAATATQVPPNVYGFINVNSSNNDGFYNWDSDCFVPGTCDAPNVVDEPVDLIFFNNASVNSVKSVLGTNFQFFCPPNALQSNCTGQPQAAFYVNNGTQGPFLNFTQDSGEKSCVSTGCGGTNIDAHYRVYGDSQNRLGFDPGWGFYVFGSSHEDIFENTPNGISGFNEDSEFFVEQVARATGLQHFGWTVFDGVAPATGGTSLGNAFSGWACCEVNGNGIPVHAYVNNGNATAFFLP